MVKVRSPSFQQCLGSLSCCLLKCILKREFSDIYLITFFGDGNFENTSAMRVIFSFEKVQNLIYISKMERKIKKMYFVSETMGSDLVALNFLYQEEKICHRQSMC